MSQNNLSLEEWRLVADCVLNEINEYTDDEDWELNNKEVVNNLRNLLNKIHPYTLKD